jgi:glycosyltransferase involved in cell wall biosynthesis
MDKPYVSVVIPVLNDDERLKICLEALAGQTYPADRYEVIVVDNGSDDRCQVLGSRCQVLGDRYKDRAETSNLEPSTYNLAPDTLFLREPVRGLHRARNTGIAQAKGEILAFTDADCIPEKDWLEKGVAVILSEPNRGLVAGRIVVFPAASDNPTAAELFEMITAFRQKEYVERWHFGATANVFTTKQVIEKIGLFDGMLKSGADLEWGQRVFAAGYKQIYAEDVIARHPARHSLAAVLKKERRVVGGLNDIRRKQGKYPLRVFFMDLKNDWPGFRDFRAVLGDRRLSGLARKVKALAVMVCVKIARITERIRLSLGGKSKLA